VLKGIWCALRHLWQIHRKDGENPMWVCGLTDTGSGAKIVDVLIGDRIIRASVRLPVPGTPSRPS